MAHPARQWTLRRRFTRLLLFAALIPALLFSAVMLWQQYRASRTSLGERVGLSASLTSTSIDDFMRSRLAGLTLLASTRDAPLADWSPDLDRLRQAYPGLTSALVVDATGHVVAASPAPPPGVLGTPASRVDDRDYFTVPARTRKPHVSDAFRGRVVGNTPLVAISAPIVRNDELVGVLEASINVESFARQRGEAFRMNGYEMLLLDRGNHVIHATGGLPYGFMDAVSDPRLTIEADAPSNTARTRFEHDMLDGSAGYVARARMSSGWTLVLVAPVRNLLLSVGRNTLVLLALLMLVSLGVLAATWLQLRDLAQGTGHLLDTLRKFALGDPLDTGEQAPMPRELQPVASAIRDMSGRLNTAYGELSNALITQRDLAASLQRVVDDRDQEIADRTAELRNAVDELEKLASIDALTGALNVRGFRRDIGALVEDPECEDMSVGALIIDIDHFKAYNDRYGHPAGDTALRRVVGAMQSCMRGASDTLARVGGEEFAILLRDADIALAIEVAQRICDTVRDARIPHADGIDGVITISIGIAAQPSPELMDHLLSQADEALYRAKRAGRGRISR
ncbi:sensor domain-containing diguanylate cyclase [Marilutibacter spongiae]|uniref:diguanylate cyclase n=1 Tax=Marilutibacter spongiae TaxID=2025720 RepID=A0A7W3TKT5_9GAMM|nr:diguanylate cyclase [Lysobacter spongiae]MBB1060170.1 GGDEF domain-containing protein [Lysobacter spongiae]